MKHKKPKIVYSAGFEDLIINRAIELHNQGLREGILDKIILGELKVFLDKIPKHCMYKATIKNDSPVLAGKIICVGSDEL